MDVNAQGEIAAERMAHEAGMDLESTFRAHYERMARVIARVVHDPARAEELAVEVFLKWWRIRPAYGEDAGGWLYRAAVRMALDELRRRARRERYERLLGFLRRPQTPEEISVERERQEQVRAVLRSLPVRQAEMLLLRGEGLSYGELASALELNPASVGNLLGRAQEAFRKEYGKRYGEA
jgi:RNA polymerase sigma-70 factor (ECF subfamily)